MSDKDLPSFTACKSVLNQLWRVFISERGLIDSIWTVLPWKFQAAIVKKVSVDEWSNVDALSLFCNRMMTMIDPVSFVNSKSLCCPVESQLLINPLWIQLIKIVVAWTHGLSPSDRVINREQSGLTHLIGNNLLLMMWKQRVLECWGSFHKLRNNKLLIDETSLRSDSMEGV